MNVRLKAFLLVALAVCFVGGPACEELRTPGPAAAPPGRVLFVADEWKQLAPLVAFLRAEGGFAIQTADQKDIPETLSAYYAVFMYLHGPMTPETERTLVRYATVGGRLVVLHHGMASARAKNPDWLRMAGIRILPRDDPKAPWRVLAPVTHTLVNLRPGHYITTHGVAYDRKVRYQSPDAAGPAGEFPALDFAGTEMFLNQQFTDGQEKTVLFGSMCTDPKSGEVIMQDRGGWYKPVAKGWLFCLQPGHAESDFLNRNYCQIVLNCLTWRP
jgi:hypothetical protein